MVINEEILKTSSSSSNSIFDSPVRLGKRRASQRRASPSTSATESLIRPARGRGRGRGKGKGPASRKGKKSVQEADPNRDEVALSVIQTRKDRFREDMKTMPREQLEEIILGVLDENPGLILDFHKPVARGEGGYHPPEGAESPDWCVCGKCREMPTQAERICCEREPRHCFSLLPDFTVLVLDPAVLRLARLQRRDILLLDDADEEDTAQGQQTCCLQTIYTVGTWKAWSRQQKSDSIMLCFGDQRQVP
ncbi:hypothetical protein DPMN_151208 [Dreissena polymorpha]|uniref:P2X purinoreceptor 7 intracellular domain-containing protein n=1 Tax=Dreissena polymorpha TaxID=45954 RepID=A0A9D4FH61_DREPO|nr:hypothetical protein DPMN_151208 [Dreissena polymorpha]